MNLPITETKESRTMSEKRGCVTLSSLHPVKSALSWVIVVYCKYAIEVETNNTREQGKQAENELLDCIKEYEKDVAVHFTIRITI